MAELVCRSIQVNGRRTSMRIESNLWSVLTEIAAREGVEIDALLSAIESRAKGDVERSINLTANVRLFALEYFRSAATEDGHRRAGHGQGDPLAGVDVSKTKRQIPGRQRPKPSAGGTVVPL